MDNLHNSLSDINLFGLNHNHLLNYLDRLKNQAEELLRDVRGVYIKPSPINGYLKMKYQKELHLKKDDYIKQVLFLDNNSIFILYSDSSYTIQNIKSSESLLGQIIQSNNNNSIKDSNNIDEEVKIEEQNSINNKNEQINIKQGYLHNENISNIQNYINNIIYYDKTSSQIIIYDPIRYKQYICIILDKRVVQESVVFRIINNEIILVYKISNDITDSLESNIWNEVQHEYGVYQINEEINENNNNVKISCTMKEQSRFTSDTITSDKIIILKNKSLILYNSFNRSNDGLIYQQYTNHCLITKQRISPLSGQIIDVIEYSQSNKIGFVINVLSESSFKILVHDLDIKQEQGQLSQLQLLNQQQPSNKETTINLLQINKNVLITQVFTFFDDRYIGLQIQNMQFGCRNIIYDINNQNLITVMNGDNVYSCCLQNNNSNNDHQLRLCLYNNHGCIDQHSLKIIQFTHPKITLMQFLLKQNILQQYGEQACKEIIDMIL